MTTHTPKELLELGHIDCEHVTRVAVCDPNNLDTVWLYDATGKLETHCPADRVGGPFRIMSYVPSDGDKWFLFAVVDSFFPLHDLCRGDSFESAYEQYIDWAAEHRHIKIDEPDLADYCEQCTDCKGEGCDNCHKGQVYNGQYDSSGNPVETDNINGSEVKLLAISWEV